MSEAPSATPRRDRSGSISVSEAKDDADLYMTADLIENADEYRDLTEQLAKNNKLSQLQVPLEVRDLHAQFNTPARMTLRPSMDRSQGNEYTCEETTQYQRRKDQIDKTISGRKLDLDTLFRVEPSAVSPNGMTIQQSQSDSDPERNKRVYERLPAKAVYHLAYDALLCPCRFDELGREIQTPKLEEEMKVLVNHLNRAFHKTHTEAEVIKKEGDKKSRQQRFQLWKVKLLQQLEGLENTPMYSNKAFSTPQDYSKWLKIETNAINERLLDVSDYLAQFIDNDTAVAADGVLGPVTRSTWEFLCFCFLKPIQDTPDDPKANRGPDENTALTFHIVNARSTYGAMNAPAGGNNSNSAQPNNNRERRGSRTPSANSDVSPPEEKEKSTKLNNLAPPTLASGKGSAGASAVPGSNRNSILLVNSYLADPSAGFRWLMWSLYQLDMDADFEAKRGDSAPPAVARTRADTRNLMPAIRTESAGYLATPLPALSDSSRHILNQYAAFFRVGRVFRLLEHLEFLCSNQQPDELYVNELIAVIDKLERLRLHPAPPHISTANNLAPWTISERKRYDELLSIVFDLTSNLVRYFLPLFADARRHLTLKSVIALARRVWLIQEHIASRGHELVVEVARVTEAIGEEKEELNAVDRIQKVDGLLVRNTSFDYTAAGAAAVAARKRVFPVKGDGMFAKTIAPLFQQAIVDDYRQLIESTQLPNKVTPVVIDLHAFDAKKSATFDNPAKGVTTAIPAPISITVTPAHAATTPLPRASPAASPRDSPTSSSSLMVDPDADVYTHYSDVPQLLSLIERAQGVLSGLADGAYDDLGVLESVRLDDPDFSLVGIAARVYLILLWKDTRDFLVKYVPDSQAEEKDFLQAPPQAKPPAMPVFKVFYALQTLVRYASRWGGAAADEQFMKSLKPSQLRTWFAPYVDQWCQRCMIISTRLFADPVAPTGLAALLGRGPSPAPASPRSPGKPDEKTVSSPTLDKTSAGQSATKKPDVYELAKVFALDFQQLPYSEKHIRLFVSVLSNAVKKSMSDQLRLISSSLEKEDKKKKAGWWGYEKPKNRGEQPKVTITADVIESLNTLYSSQRKMLNLVEHLPFSTGTDNKDAWKELQDFSADEELELLPARIADGLGYFLRMQIHELLWKRLPKGDKISEEAITDGLAAFRVYLVAQLDNLVNNRLEIRLFDDISMQVLRQITRQLENELTNSLDPEMDTKKFLSMHQRTACMFVRNISTKIFVDRYKYENSQITEEFSYVTQLTEVLQKPLTHLVEQYDKMQETEYESKLRGFPLQGNNQAYLVDIRRCLATLRDQLKAKYPHLTKLQLFGVIKHRVKHGGDRDTAAAEKIAGECVDKHNDDFKKMRDWQKELLKRLAGRQLLHTPRPETHSGFFSKLFGK